MKPLRLTVVSVLMQCGKSEICRLAGIYLNAFSPRNPPLQKKIPAVLDHSRIFVTQPQSIEKQCVKRCCHRAHCAWCASEEATGRNRFGTAWRHALAFQHVR